MSAPFRRPRGTETTQINLHIVPEAKASLDAIAAAAGVPQWAVFESAMRAAEARLDADGIPEDWDLPRPSKDAMIDTTQYRKTA